MNSFTLLISMCIPPPPILMIGGTVPPAVMFERVSGGSWGAKQLGSLLYSNPAEKTAAFRIEPEPHPRLYLASTKASRLQWKIGFSSSSFLFSTHAPPLEVYITTPRITGDIITALVNYCSETSAAITRVQPCHGNYLGWHRCSEDRRTCKLSWGNCRWKWSEVRFVIPFV